MREIKFRGQRLDNRKWAYGYLNVREDGQVFIFRGDVAVSVDPSTVGQYTGLKDKNGTEIYEKDIVKIYDPERDEEDRPISTEAVDWSESGGYWIDVDIGDYYPPLGAECIEVEVIGNLYENPELLN